MLRSIKSKVLFSQIALIVLVAVSMGITGYFIMRDYLMHAQQEKLEFIARSKAEDVKQQFAYMKDLFDTITTDEVLEVYARTFKEHILIEHFSKFRDAFPTIVYADFAGTEQFRLVGDETSEEFHDFSDTVLFQDATWRPGEVFFSMPEPERDGEPYMNFVVARETFFGEPIGVIIGMTPLSKITAVLKDFKVGHTGFSVMMDAEGNILFHPQKERILQKVEGRGEKAQDIIFHATTLEAGFGRADVLGADSLVAYAPVEGRGWSIMAALPYKEFIAGPNILRNTIVAVSVVILLSVGLLALLAVGGITRALTELTRAAKAIAGGDLHQKVDIRSQDEVGVLSESFNKMAEELEKSYESLHRLSAHLLSVREKERKVVAREVHDELGQALSLLKIDLSWLRKRLPEDQGQLHVKANSMIELIDSTIDTVQNITEELRPLVLDDLGLVAAIESETEQFQNRTGIECELNLPTEDLHLEQSVSASVFRVFQEAMVNVLRHAGATKITINMDASNDRLVMIIKDNGKGITEEQVYAPNAFGLMGMRERIHALGGSVEISGAQGKGVTVSVDIPLDSSGESIS